jgi:hypothetical protein
MACCEGCDVVTMAIAVCRLADCWYLCRLQMHRSGFGLQGFLTVAGQCVACRKGLRNGSWARNLPQRNGLPKLPTQQPLKIRSCMHDSDNLLPGLQGFAWSTRDKGCGIYRA